MTSTPVEPEGGGLDVAELEEATASDVDVVLVAADVLDGKTLVPANIVLVVVALAICSVSPNKVPRTVRPKTTRMPMNHHFR